MIFKTLIKPFVKPKWQHTQPQKRLEAIALFSLDDAKQHSIVMDMAFNDEDESVRKAALEQLNDFDLWLKASKTEKKDRLKKLAEQRVQQAVLGEGSLTISEQQKQQFIAQCQQNAILEELALKDKDEANRIKLLAQLNKPQLFVQALQDSSASLWLKETLVTTINDLPLLEKMLKKASADIKDNIQQKVAQLKDAAQKPVILRQDITLLLAKFNALRDKVDVEEVERRQAQLQLEWENLQQSLDLLAKDEAEQFKLKYAKIQQSVNTILAPLKQQWQLKQAELAEQQEKAANEKIIAAQLAAVEATLTAGVEDLQGQQTAQYNETLKEILQQLNVLKLSHEAKNRFIAQIEQFYQKVAQIPLINDWLNQANELLARLAELPLPQDISEFSEVYPEYKNWLNQWRTNSQKMALTLPSAVVEQYQTLTSQWRAATEPLIKAQEQQFGQTKKALAELRVMLNSGKYRRAFGLFKKLSFLRDSLTESQQSKIERDYDKIKSQVEELADWQEYIATPRKQQILEEMQELVENPLDSPQQQAEKVKFTRKLWNSLGNAVSGSDEQLNQLFNETCEKAFEVCRVFYAEQQALRAQNLVVKNDICQRLREVQALLANDNNDDNASIGTNVWQQVESSLAKISSDWRNSGEVERTEVAAINQTYYDLLKPLQAALKNNQINNGQAKQGLIDQAKALLDGDDMFFATEQVKGLQTQWRSLGFAGKKEDGRLWAAFRAINDSIFAQRDAAKTERVEANKQQVDQWLQQINDLMAAIDNAEHQSALNDIETQIRALASEIKSAHKAVQEKVTKALQGLDEQCSQRKAAINDQAAKQYYVDIFNQFIFVSQHDSLDNDNNSAWNDLFGQLAAHNNPELRYDLTLGLEIAQGVESPAADRERRMALQMEMLSNKHRGGENLDIAQQLKQWFAVGKLNEDEQPLFDRVKALFL